MNLSVSDLVKLDEEDFSEDVAVWIEHRAEEYEIVGEIADHIAEFLNPIWKQDDLWVSFNGKEHKIPLTFTPHDRYVAISSIAVILKGKYSFWLLLDSLGGDTHGLLVLGDSEAIELETEHSDWCRRKLTKLELGKDYFYGIGIPYLGCEDNNPNFSEEAKAFSEKSKKSISKVLRHLVSILLIFILLFELVKYPKFWVFVGMIGLIWFYV